MSTDVDAPRPRLTIPGANLTPAGFLAATALTPDIFYPDEAKSARVAALAFLTLWHLDQPVREQIAPKLNLMIAGYAPSTGGRDLEIAMQVSQHGFLRPELPKPPIHTQSIPERSYAARVYPDIKAIAVYAMSDQGYDNLQSAGHVNLPSIVAPPTFETDSLSDQFHTLVNDDHNSHTPISFIIAALARPDTQRHLKVLFEHEARSLLAHVPAHICHEIGHLLANRVLSRAHELLGNARTDLFNGNTRYPAVLAKEAAELGRSPDHPLIYFSRPEEAVAELTGTALLKMVSRNAGLKTQLATNGVEEVMPESYELICRAVEAEFAPAPAPAPVPAMARVPA